MRLWVRTSMRINMLLEFSRTADSTPNFPDREKLYQRLIPISGQDASRDEKCRKEKKTLLGTVEHILKLQVVTKTYPPLGRGILTSPPFTNNIKLCYKELPSSLGPTNPCTSAVHMEPFSSSVFKVRG